MKIQNAFNDFYNEFKDWTKEEILQRTFDIILESSDKDRQLEAYENMRKEAIEELSKDYKNLPDIDEWYATDKQWHNYYFEKSEQDDYKIENTLNILNKVGGSDD